MRRLILFVEGEGEADAVPTLVKTTSHREGRMARHLARRRAVPRRLGRQTGERQTFSDWKRFLGASLKRPNVGGVLLILDGDIEKVGGKAFCAADSRQVAGRRGEGCRGGSDVLRRGRFCKTGIRNMADRGGRFPGGPTIA